MSFRYYNYHSWSIYFYANFHIFSMKHLFLSHISFSPFLLSSSFTTERNGNFLFHFQQNHILFQWMCITDTHQNVSSSFPFTLFPYLWHNEIYSFFSPILFFCRCSSSFLSFSLLFSTRDLGLSLSFGYKCIQIWWICFIFVHRTCWVECLFCCWCICTHCSACVWVRFVPFVLYVYFICSASDAFVPSLFARNIFYSDRTCYAFAVLFIIPKESFVMRIKDCFRLLMEMYTYVTFSMEHCVITCTKGRSRSNVHMYLYVQYCGWTSV